MMGLLIKKHYLDENASVNYFSLGTGIKSIPTDSEWMTIYHDGKKLGYSVFSIYNMDNEGYVITSTTRMKAAIAGLEANIILDNEVKLDTLFRLNEFEFQLTSDQYSTHLLGRKSGTTMEITTIHGLDSTSFQIAIPEELYTYIGIQPLIAQQGIIEGDRFKIPSFDPVSMEMDDVEVIHEGRETLTFGDEEFELNRIKILYRGIPAIRWLDDSGLTYREETLMGLMMERTSAEEALSIDESNLSGIDLLDIYAITPDKHIPKQNNIEELILEITGIDPIYFKNMDSPRQRVISENPLQVKFTLSDFGNEPDSNGVFLYSSEIIQPDRPKIISKMKEIIGNSLDSSEKAESIRRWVYRYLKKFPVVSLSSALEILKHGEGACSEHTILYTSLSRAAGIPTKIHIGVVYLNGKFLYHAWPVVYIDNKWISIDPTLDQPVADITHIAIMESDFTNLSDLIPVLGRISIKVVNQVQKENGQ